MATAPPIPTNPQPIDQIPFQNEDERPRPQA